MNRTTRHTAFRLNLQRWLPALLAMVLLLSACSSSGGSRDADAEPATIKVMYWNDQSFNQEYGMLFYATHPHIDIQVVSTAAIQFSGGENGEDKLIEFIQTEKPDLLLLTQDQYEKLAADGRLASLESFVTRDKFDLEGLVPGMVDLLREKGGGELYGLTPSFSSQAIYYNKDLFDRYNIEYPTDKMSWEEVLNLAGRFPTDGSDEDRIYGLYFGGSADLHALAQQIGMTQGLRVVNPADKRVSIDSESWVRVYETALKAFRSGTVYAYNDRTFSGSMTYEDFLLRDPFIGGKVAMMVNSSYLVQQIKEAASVVPDKAVKNWDLVTMPVDPANPDFSYQMSFNNIFAINAESANLEAAWEFIRYIHSDDYARVKSKASVGQFPVRTKYIQDEEGRNMAAFYALKPSSQNTYAGFEDLPGNFYMQFYSIGSEEAQAMMNDEKTVREALASMQTRLQAALDEAIANQESGESADASSGSGIIISESGGVISFGVGKTEAEAEADVKVEADVEAE